ncbi:GDP-mannose pyrophosphatase NudK [Aquiflexum sp.]|uniref:GDP-mannose pyrophosphatase NudK n=1 Tax=Aquiflexum sp. TaxID=1872584 RepID=UPI0035945E1C
MCKLVVKVYLDMIKNIKILKKEILSDNWYTLKKVTFEYQKSDGSVHTQVREAFDRGNGAAILLYSNKKGTVVLTMQFRLPTYLNGNESGMMIEACAGMLDGQHPEEAIRRETEEETGYKIKDILKVFEAYTSPGAVTEILHCYIARYSKDMKVGSGGGAEDEDENIEVLEISFDKALEMITTGEIRDAKTIMLLQYLRCQQIM